jgi:hypothetical protein
MMQALKIVGDACMATKKDETKVAGGKARAVALPEGRRKEIASGAAKARWKHAKPLKATHRGNFLDEFGIDVECYVLNDEQKTAVISQRGMGKAIGLAERGGALRSFVSSKVMSGFVGIEIHEKLENPLKFQYGLGATQNLIVEGNGYDVTLLIDVCKAIVSAETAGALTDRQRPLARQAHIILSASAKAGIKGLVYALSGYDATREEIIAAFKSYVQEEAKKYEKEFPSELYDQWYRLYNIEVFERGRPWDFKHLTVKHIYYPLAKSNGKILELLRANKSTGEDRKKKLFQFLNEVGARALRMQIGRVLEMSESSKTKIEYENRIVERFGGQTELDV